MKMKGLKGTKARYTHWRQSRSDFRQKSIPRRQIDDKVDSPGDTFDSVADFGDGRQNGNDLNIYESRDDPVT